MDKIREEEKAAYDANHPEMEQGLKDVKLAFEILNDHHYAKADKFHGSSAGAGSGIVGMLEVIELDFHQGPHRGSGTEEKETKENASEKTTGDQGVKYKTNEAAALGQGCPSSAPILKVFKTILML